LISFLAYTSQYFFLHFESVPLRKDEVWKTNIFALCIWVCYFRSCYVDPGRLPASQQTTERGQEEEARAARRQRWCRRCEAYKPPRAHHCKTCQRFGLKPIRDLKLLTCAQMYPQDGSPLPMDIKLRVIFYLSPLLPLLVLRRSWHGLPRDSALGAGIYCLGKSKPPQCELIASKRSGRR
jgi:ribosomal protein L40E